MTSNAGHVFISHGSENRGEAGEISAFLEARGIRTWIAPRDVRPGMDYSEQLQSAIEECIAFVVLVTDMANKSPYVRAETEMAFSNSKPIFPVRKSDIKPAAGLAFFLKIRHWTDAFGGDADASMDRLARELRVLSGLPDEGPPGPDPVSAPPPPPPAAKRGAAPSGRAAAPATDPPPATRGGVPKTALIAGLAAALVLIIVVVLLAARQMRQDQPPQPVPALDPAANNVEGDKPADAAGDTGSAATAAIDASLVVGRWTDSGDCANALEYTADGRVVAPDGSAGLWQLNGDQLTVTGPNGSQTVRITSIDQSAAYAVNPDGSVVASQRC